MAFRAAIAVLPSSLGSLRPKSTSLSGGYSSGSSFFFAQHNCLNSPNLGQKVGKEVGTSSIAESNVSTLNDDRCLNHSLFA